MVAVLAGLAGRETVCSGLRESTSGGAHEVFPWSSPCSRSRWGRGGSRGLGGRLGPERGSRAVRATRLGWDGIGIGRGAAPDRLPAHGLLLAPPEQSQPEPNRSRAGTEPISMRNRTDLDAELNRSRRRGGRRRVGGGSVAGQWRVSGGESTVAVGSTPGAARYRAAGRPAPVCDTPPVGSRNPSVRVALRWKLRGSSLTPQIAS